MSINTTSSTNEINSYKSFFSLDTMITFFTALYTFIQVIRAVYNIQGSRFQELQNTIKDGIQFIWDTYVKDRKEHGLWNHVCKNKATDLCIAFVNENMSTKLLVTEHRLRRLIKEAVAYRKITRSDKLHNL